jgi:hypothetical protein
MKPRREIVWAMVASFVSAPGRPRIRPSRASLKDVRRRAAAGGFLCGVEGGEGIVPPGMDLTWLLHQVFGLDGPPASQAGAPRPLVRASRRSVAEHPGGVVSAVLTRLRETRYEQLSEPQRAAWLVATYDSMVQNRGHEEYFSVFGVARASEVRVELGALGARTHVRLLEDAIERHMSVPGESGFVGLPAGPHVPEAPRYDDVDAAYRGLGVITERLLQDLVMRQLTHFVEIDG